MVDPCGYPPRLGSIASCNLHWRSCRGAFYSCTAPLFINFSCPCVNPVCLQDKLNRNRDITESDVCRYNSPQGLESFRKVVANIIQRLLLPSLKPKVPMIAIEWIPSMDK